MLYEGRNVEIMINLCHSPARRNTSRDMWEKVWFLSGEIEIRHVIRSSSAGELLRCYRRSDQRVQRLPVHVLSIFWFPTDETKVAFSPFLTLSPSFSLPNTGCISGNPFITETATLGENVWLHKKKYKKIRNVALSRDGNILCVNCLSSCHKWRNFLFGLNAHFSFKITFKGF